MDYETLEIIDMLHSEGYSDDEIVEILQAGRKGMKWYQNIFTKGDKGSSASGKTSDGSTSGNKSERKTSKGSVESRAKKSGDRLKLSQKQKDTLVNVVLPIVAGSAAIALSTVMETRDYNNKKAAYERELYRAAGYKVYNR